VIDLHSHTTASDGTLPPAALLEAAAAAGLTVLAITDHDTTAGYVEACGAPGARVLELVSGVEVTAVSDGKDVHVLGYFIDPAAPALVRFLEGQRLDRVRRVSEMADRLAALGCPIDVQPVLGRAASGRSVGRPQIADLLLAAGFVRSRDEAFDRFLEYGAPAYVPRRGASPEQVIAAIHDAGGLASLAHPGVTGRDDLIDRLAAAGLDAIEVRHADHPPDVERRYRDVAARLRLLVTGGSDFHGAADHHACSLGSVTLPRDDYDRLRSAAGGSGR
jgi:predicted metal-dependent phosphoesterase TrpH